MHLCLDYNLDREFSLVISHTTFRKHHHFVLAWGQVAVPHRTRTGDGGFGTIKPTTEGGYIRCTHKLNSGFIFTDADSIVDQMDRTCTYRECSHDNYGHVIKCHGNIQIWLYV